MNSLNHLIVLFKVYISFTHHHLKLITHAIMQLRMQLHNYARVTHAFRTRYARVKHALPTRYAHVTHALRVMHAITQLRTRYVCVTQAVPRAPTKLNRALDKRRSNLTHVRGVIFV